MSYLIGNIGTVGFVPTWKWFRMNGRFFKRVGIYEHDGPYKGLLVPAVSMPDARTGFPSISHQNNIVVQSELGAFYLAECDDECEYLEPNYDVS